MDGNGISRMVQCLIDMKLWIHLLDGASLELKNIEFTTTHAPNQSVNVKTIS